MSPLATIIAQFLMGWLASKCGGTDPKPAVESNYDPDTDEFDEDFMLAGVTKAKRAQRRLHRQDPSEPKRRPVAELRAEVEKLYRTALTTPDAERLALCAAIQPLTDE